MARSTRLPRRAQDLGHVGIHSADAGTHAGRQGVAQESQRAAHDRGLRRPVGQAGTLACSSVLALVSISLGVFNLLPVPVLDGGSFAVLPDGDDQGQSRVRRAFDFGQRIGMAMLAVLMALALFNDLSRLSETPSAQFAFGARLISAPPCVVARVLLALAVLLAPRLASAIGRSSSRTSASRACSARRPAPSSATCRSRSATASTTRKPRRR